MKNPKYFRRLEQIPQLSKEEARVLQPVVDKFDFRTNEYYQSLIDWGDPDDPIRRIVIPDINELNEWGELDASDEEIYTVVPGLEHKYEFTAVLLVSYVCGAYCRFCFLAPNSHFPTCRVYLLTRPCLKRKSVLLYAPAR